MLSSLQCSYALRFPTLTRGLVAILLYYDGRCSMVASLRTLIQAREGVSWSLGLTQATVNFVTSFTDELFADGLMKKILDLINSISVKDELEKLAKGRAIGDAKHRQQIIDYINEQRSCLADCLLHWACQNPFPKDETLLLYGHLQKMKVEPVPEEGGAKSAGAGGLGSKVGSSKAGVVGGAKEEIRLDAVGVALFSALLACFNIGDATAGMLAKSMLHYSHGWSVPLYQGNIFIFCLPLFQRMPLMCPWLMRTATLW